MKRTILFTLSALLLFACGQPREKDTPMAAIERYVAGHQIPDNFYQDFGWEAKEIPLQ